jgi:hypothetical protein
MSIAIGASPQRRQHFIEIQNDRVKIPTTLLYDVKTRWNSTLNMLERSVRLREFTKDWLQTYPQFSPLWSTPEEWRQIEYILEVLQPIRFWTLWMSKTRGVTIHRVFQVYQDIFDHLEMQISKLERKRMQWKVDIREGLLKAKLKAAAYYGKTESPRGLLFGIATCLNPYCKLNLFREWDLDASGETEYEKSYKKEFIAYYDLYYAPRNNQAPDMAIPRSSLNSRSKHLHASRHRAITLSEALAYLETESEIEPPEPAAEVTDPTREACPAGIFYEANILEWWKVNAGRFPNLARMARDILAVQGGSVGVERVFSMARDVIPYRRSRLKSSTIRSSMLVKSYENDELRRVLEGHDSEREAEKLEEMAAVEDYRCWADRKEESMEHDNGCISDDDESHKKDTEWSFVDQDGRRAFGREPRAILPDRGLVESQYARPGPPRNQDDVDQLAGSEESDAEERIWDSTVNMYVESDTDEEEGSQEEEAEVSGEGLSDLESIDQLGDQNSGCLEGSRGRQDEVFSEEEVLSGISDSLPVIRVTRKRDQTGTNTTIRVPLRKRAGTGGKEKKRSRFH